VHEPASTTCDARTPFLKTLSKLPIDPDVTAHSIIAVKGDGPVESGSDGVVRYLEHAAAN